MSESKIEVRILGKLIGHCSNIWGSTYGDDQKTFFENFIPLKDFNIPSGILAYSPFEEELQFYANILSDDLDEDEMEIIASFKIQMTECKIGK